MPILDRETVCFVYYGACETMDHDTALRHTADECCLSVEAVEQALAVETAA